MKGIILAGGTGSRLYPITKVTNKHLLPVGRYPMIYHAVYKLKQCEITDIMIITGKEHMGDVVSFLGSGQEFGVSFTYRVQDKAGGIAQALGLCEDFVGKDRMVVILGDNIFSDDIRPYVEEFASQKEGAKVLLQSVDDPERFGVANIQNRKIIEIEEKPKEPKSSYAVTGIYLYDSKVFSYIKELKPSARGELEITDINNWYLKRGVLTYNEMSGWWTDAGTHVSLQRANTLAQDINLGKQFNGE
ncbi:MULTISPECIES: sugar phosphate nucleotidyltransferase [Bacillus]|uniref:sugar phosphate nucleotidyltransferase n=1 Tax=Bacillus TaxID=1386 RepID=UPI0003311A7E|nr:NTP transferase domain-containing protein [Bacillus wiedmannii]EOP08162.1 glucose-1-phosphate thymidylyltransferase [Bacillus cereus BAG2O-3]EOQ13139.1 glucose-1-phosphate thymidylyltransferase [Bacillus cereus B5-2]EOQ33954.1 glucose-1-phosphate thymidylyltransferase [Bacillus cereus BAG3O-1]MDA1600006.1 sugar phosphate nucleotidyltransferase [Bacillus cereus]RFB10371.1 spore coat protein [Bacillus sp. OE]HDR8170017.1 NTP transferase domain-containing protein [Bacillus thuringiensis]